MITAREDEIISNIVRDSERKVFTCALCQFTASSRHKVFCHLESKHFKDSSVTYSCPFCQKVLTSRNSLGIHVSRNHKYERGNSLNSIFPKDHWRAETPSSRVLALVFFLGPAPVVHIPAETVKILETVKPGSAPNKESAAGQAAWQCTLCKRMFSSKKYIVSHMKEDHHVTKEKAIDLSITEI